ncbi:22728_t:CDS:2, partial [Dentiscutata erythropus]
NWLNYLRNDSNDYNKISTPPGKKDIVDFIRNIESKKYIQGTEIYEGYLTKWTLNCKDVTFTLDVSQKIYELSGENKQKPVHKKEQQKANMYVRECKVLKNDDLVMVTEKYVSDKYWEIFDDSLTERFLPQSDFDGIIDEANIKSDKDTTNLYDLLLDYYIKENFFLAHCGKILREIFKVK